MLKAILFAAVFLTTLCTGAIAYQVSSHQRYEDIYNRCMAWNKDGPYATTDRGVKCDRMAEFCSEHNISTEGGICNGRR